MYTDYVKPEERIRPKSIWGRLRRACSYRLYQTLNLQRGKR